MMKKFLTALSMCLFLCVFAQTKRTVKQGDNLSTIAREYGVTVDELMKLNPQLYNRPLFAGDVLVISPNKTIVPKSSSKQAGGAKSRFGEVILDADQSIGNIATRYYISENDIKLLNPGIKSRIKAGDKIILPNENILKNKITGLIESENKAKNKEDQQLAKIILHPDQIIYSITKYYNISEENLRKLNPDLDKKLKIGSEITLPLENIVHSKGANDRL